MIRVPTLPPASMSMNARGASSRPWNSSCSGFRSPASIQPRIWARASPVAVGVVEHQESFHAHPVVDEKTGDAAWTRCRATGVVLGHDAAADDATVGLHAPQGAAEDLAAGVVEVDVDAPGAGLAELLAEVRALVVHGGVETETVREQVALLVAPGDADGTAAGDLRHLPDQVAHRAGGGGHHDRLPRFRFAQVIEPEIRRETVRAVHAEMVGRIAAAFDDMHAARFVHGIVLPAGRDTSPAFPRQDPPPRMPRSWRPPSRP